MINGSASLSGNNLNMINGLAGAKGLASSIDTIDLTNNNYHWEFILNTPSNTLGNLTRDFGSTFSLFNDPNYRVSANSDYENLGNYATPGDPGRGMINAIVVEFDNFPYNYPTNERFIDDFVISQGYTNRSHIAITHPNLAMADPANPDGYIRKNLVHEGLSVLNNFYANNSDNYVTVEWKYNEATQKYELSYKYYQGQSTASGTPFTGRVEYSLDQLKTIVKDPSKIQFGFTASSGSLVNKIQSIKYPPTYTFNLVYRIKNEAGQIIPNKDYSPSKQMTVPTTTGVDISTLPALRPGYRLQPNQPTVINISDGATYPYYYIDEKPIIEGTDNRIIMRGTPFNIMDGVTARDGVDGPLTNISTSIPNINTNQVGVYNIEYKVTDSVGNTTTKTRTVTVVEAFVVRDPDNPEPLADGYVRLTFDGGANGTVDGFKRYRYIDVFKGLDWTYPGLRETFPQGALYKDGSMTFSAWDPAVPASGQVTLGQTFTALYQKTLLPMTGSRGLLERALVLVLVGSGASLVLRKRQARK